MDLKVKHFSKIITHTLKFQSFALVLCEKSLTWKNDINRSIHLKKKIAVIIYRHQINSLRLKKFIKLLVVSGSKWPTLKL